jgi:hypothetical protein
MDPEEKQEEKKECLTRNVLTTTEDGSDGTSQAIERAEKGKTSANNSLKCPELPGNVKTLNDNPNFQTVLLNSGEIKINAEEEKDYWDITRALNQTNIEWHSFENKLTRPVKVMARNIHASCSAEDVMKDLKNKNFAIMEVSQIRSRKDKILLPLYMLTFEKKEDIKRIFEIKEILSMKVTIEALRRSKLIPQCKNCQAYGHTEILQERGKVCEVRRKTSHERVPKTRAKSPKMC